MPRLEAFDNVEFTQVGVIAVASHIGLCLQDCSAGRQTEAKLPQEIREARGLALLERSGLKGRMYLDLPARRW